ncbi:MAG TPA: DUF883 C-terminal domain-containing protein [Thermoanaerobaculia bacterium]|nr:DUF883 C-terminal domain-containing protein [Thermoanaerobaculia bacterium]
MEETNTTPKGAEGGTAEDPGRFGRAREFVGEKYSAASDAMRNKYNVVREKVEDVDFAALMEQTRNYVRTNPGKALLISIGVGFAIGLLLRRDDDEE